VIPRKNETDAVQAILESEDFDSAADMAKAVVRALADELLKRELHVIVPQHGAQGWGPYWTRTEAERAWRKEIGAAEVGPAALLRVFPWAPPEAVVQSTKPCSCGHAAEQHVIKQDRRGKTTGPYECGVCAKSVRKGAENACQRFQEAA
jgi:hypothetical protein